MSLKTSFVKAYKKAENVMTENGSTILTVLGIGGFIVSILLAIEETPTAEEKLKELEKEMALEADAGIDYIPPSKEQVIIRKAKKVVPVYAPTIITATLSTACIACAKKADSKKIAVLTTAYELSEASRRDYIRKVKEKIGEKAEAEIQDAYYKEKIENTMPSGPQDSSIICTGRGEQLFYDAATGRYFRCSTLWLDKCRVNISQMIFTDDYASLNELYYMIGLDPVELGNLAGWNNKDDLDSTTKLIDMRYDTNCYMTKWGETCATFKVMAHDGYIL